MRSRRARQTGPLVLGTIFLIVGSLFLLRNAGILDVDWGIIWPVVIIVIGAAIIIGSLRRAGRGTGVASVIVPPDGAARLELALRLGAGHYRLAGGASALVEASSDEPTIGHHVERQGDLARVRLTTSVDPWAWGWRGGLSWRIGVATGIPTMLDVKGGAGEFDLDLSAVAVVSASMAVGAADLRVVLPRPRGDVPVRIEAGAASLTLLAPPGVEARLTTSGVVSTSGPTESPGYTAARDRVTISVTGGAASVRLMPVG